MWGFGVFVVAVACILTGHWLLNKSKSRHVKGKKLPPGSMGFPLVGETFHLLMPSDTWGLTPFFKSRIARYGPIFRTNLVGRPIVVSADPKFNNYLIQNEDKIVERWYLDVFTSLFATEGAAETTDIKWIHKYLRNLTLDHFGFASLKDKILPQTEQMVRYTLANMSKEPVAEIKESTARMFSDFTAQLLFTDDFPKFSGKLSEKFSDLTKNIFSFPINIPGTSYNKNLKNKKELEEIMREIIRDRCRSDNKDKEGFLEAAVEDMKRDKLITEEFIVLLLYGLLYAGTGSTSTALATVLTFLAENPSALEELEAEHEAILKRRDPSCNSLTWEDYKSMTFTLQVINESMRLGSVNFGVMRKAVEDIHVNGFTIPAGWTILILTSASHYNPEVYPDPLAFKPSRWKDLDANTINKNFMPFGTGGRQCAGADYTRMIMAVFLHVLVTSYRWKKIKGGKIVRNPFLGFKEDLAVNISKKL